MLLHEADFVPKDEGVVGKGKFGCLLCVIWCEINFFNDCCISK